jgi:serine/threonine-protein phosphatase 6 regulatory subunit 3
LIRLIGADEHIYANHVDAMQWIENTDVLEMIVDKFSSSVSIIIVNCLQDLSVLIYLY